MIDLHEAFTKLNMLESGNYNLLDEKDKSAMKAFLEDEEENNFEVEADDVDVIDPNAEDEFELEDSYVGQYVLRCPICMSPFFRTKEEMDENNGQEETCPYCSSVEKMEVMGKIVAVDEEPEGEQEEASEEPIVEIEKKDLDEDLENVTIETENEVINVSSEEKEDNFGSEEGPEQAEVIAPVDGDEYTPSEEDDEIDEVDEDSFEEVAESLLRENYKNVRGFKVTKAYDKKNHIMIEGIVTLSNGDRKLTNFRVRPGRFDRRTNTAACLIENMQLGKKKVVRARVSMTEGIFGNNKKKK